MALGWLTKRPVEESVVRAWVRPFLSDRAVRRDTGKVLRGISSRFTLTAAQKLSHFDRPTLMAWAAKDRFFPVRHAERLAELMPDARLELIEDSYTFVPEDQPAALAGMIADFLH